MYVASRPKLNFGEPRCRIHFECPQSWWENVVGRIPRGQRSVVFRAAIESYVMEHHPLVDSPDEHPQSKRGEG